MNRERVTSADKRGMAWGVAILVVLFHIALIAGPGWFSAMYQ